MPTPVVIPSPRSRPTRLLLALALAVVGFLIPVRTPHDGSLARASYDLLQLLRPAPSSFRTESQVVLVYLDLASHRDLDQDPAARWNRSLHARLIDRLKEAGARAIVFDILFDAPAADPAADAAFAEAMRRHGRVFLAAEHHYSDQASGRFPGVHAVGIEPPVAALRDAAAGWGVAELAVDPDFVVRRTRRQVEGAHPTLAWAAAQGLGFPITRKAEQDDQEWIRYYGAPLALPHVSYRSVLDPAGANLSQFRNKVVFVGALPMAGVFSERRDELRSPLATWEMTRDFMPGVEVHATQFLNWARGDSLHRLPTFLERGMLAGIGLALGLGLPLLRPVAAALVAFAAAMLAPLAALGAAVAGQVWFPWLLASAVLVPAAWLGAILVHALDWGRHRLHLESLRRADARRLTRQAALLDKARDLILVTDREGTLLYANPRARTVLGPDRRHFPSPAVLGARLPTLLSTGAWSGVLELPGDETLQPLVLDSRWTLLRDDHGAPESILMICTDISEQRHLELSFLRAQRWEAVGSLAGGMAHDLNNTLAPALLGLQILQRAEPRPDVQRTLAMIENNTRRGIDTVRQVLGFLRGSAPDFESIDPAALVQDMAGLVRESFPRNITLVTLVPPVRGRILGNIALLQQALLNLCLNARDAMPEGGQLSLAVDDAELSAEEAATVPGARAGSFVMLAVSDSGEGIPKERLDRIFEPLFTTKPEGHGTGLGLASVSRIVQQHQGFVAVTSDVGAGSTFELYLPRTLPDASAPLSPTPAPPG